MKEQIEMENRVCMAFLLTVCVCNRAENWNKINGVKSIFCQVCSGYY